LVQVDVTWRAARHLDQDLSLALALRAVDAPPEAELSRSGPWRLSPHYPTSRWPQGVVVTERYALPLDPGAASGAPGYALALQLGGPVPTEHVELSLPLDAPASLLASARPLTAGLGIDRLTDVTFGGQMWLLGYRWVPPGDAGGEGTLGLCWQALDGMSTNYKLFVHVLDEHSQTVAQVDTMPRGWSYPTTLWSRQELFCDRVPLPVQDLPPGGYRAALGLYRPETGRLPAIDGDGRRLSDDRFFLPSRLQIPEP
jgi:hypothetical protein